MALSIQSSLTGARDPLLCPLASHVDIFDDVNLMKKIYVLSGQDLSKKLAITTLPEVACPQQVLLCLGLHPGVTEQSPCHFTMTI